MTLTKNDMPFKITAPVGYVVEPVRYRGELCRVFVGDLLDHGRRHAQDYWLARGFVLPDASLLYATWEALYDQRHNSEKRSVETVRKLFDDDLKEHWLMTGTRIQYHASELDSILHNYNTPEQYLLTAKLGGKEGFVSDDYGLVIQALFETDNVGKFRNVVEWIAGVPKKQTCLWSEYADEYNTHALVLGVDDSDSRFNIDADDGYLSLPVRAVAVKKYFKKNRGTK